LSEASDPQHRFVDRKPSSHEAEFAPIAKKARTTISKHDVLHGNNAKHAVRNTSDPPVDDNVVEDQLHQLLDIIDKIRTNGGESHIEELRSTLLSSEIVSEIVVGAVGSVISGARARLKAEFRPRPLLKAALDTLDAMHITVIDI